MEQSLKEALAKKEEFLKNLDQKESKVQQLENTCQELEQKVTEKTSELKKMIFSFKELEKQLEDIEGYAEILAKEKVSSRFIDP
jgi:hypothetical protein